MVDVEILLNTLCEKVCELKALSQVVTKYATRPLRGLDAHVLLVWNPLFVQIPSVTFKKCYHFNALYCKFDTFFRF